MAGDWRSRRKLVTLPLPGALTPEIVLARTLEKARDGRIKSVVIGIVWDDGAVSSDYSKIGMGDALFALRAAQLAVEADVFTRPVEPGDDEFREDP